jgi:hypothetical protein
VQVRSFTESQPVQPVKRELPSGCATSVTCVGGDVFAIAAVQPAVEPLAHAMPFPVIVPLPVPPVRAVRSHVLGANVAVTDFAAVIETVQLMPDVLAHPDHDWKIEVPSGAATRITSVAGVVFGTFVEHPADEPLAHAIPGPVTVPPALVPEMRTFRANVLGWSVA